MKMNSILALALPTLLALASCDNNLIEQPEQGGGSGNGSGSADQPAYMVNEQGDTLYLVIPTVEMAPTPALTRAELTPKTYDMGHRMTLKVSPEAPKATRSVSKLPANVPIRMVIYSSSGTVYTKDYIVDANGKLSGTGGLYLPVGSYSAYCFTDAANTSGNWTSNYTIDTSNKTVTVPQGIDAAWNSTPVTLSVGMYSPNKVSATLDRKCAQISSITYACDATVLSLNVSNSTLKSVASTATSATSFGDLASSGSKDLPLPDVGSAVTPVPALSYPITGPIYLLPQSSDITFSCSANIQDQGEKSYSTTLSLVDKDGNATQLSKGQSYALTVNVHSGGIFAHSNIFWDGRTLNFYTNEDGLAVSSTPTLNPSAAAAKNYQGVFFKWGSLVGISPAGALYNASGTYDHVYTYDNTVTIYQPDNPVGGYNSYSPTSGINYDQIQYDNTATNAGILYSKYEDQNDGSNRGDICAYLTEGKWRMPTIQEINVTNQTAGTSLPSWDETALTSGSGWWRSGIWNNVTGVSPFPTNTEYGMRDLSATGHAHLRIATMNAKVDFPAGGYYNSVAASSTLHNNAGDNNLNGVGMVVNYWSGTPDNSATEGTTGVYLAAATWFKRADDGSSSNTGQQPESHGARDYAFLVRCVTAY
jgi:hypothetical protein